jgi:hypothetical protein
MDGASWKITVREGSGVGKNLRLLLIEVFAGLSLVVEVLFR